MSSTPRVTSTQSILKEDLRVQCRQALTNWMSPHKISLIPFVSSSAMAWVSREVDSKKFSCLKPTNTLPSSICLGIKNKEPFIAFKVSYETSSSRTTSKIVVKMVMTFFYRKGAYYTGPYQLGSDERYYPTPEEFYQKSTSCSPDHLANLAARKRGYNLHNKAWICLDGNWDSSLECISEKLAFFLDTDDINIPAISISKEIFVNKILNEKEHTLIDPVKFSLDYNYSIYSWRRDEQAFLLLRLNYVQENLVGRPGSKRCFQVICVFFKESDRYSISDYLLGSDGQIYETPFEISQKDYQQQKHLADLLKGRKLSLAKGGYLFMDQSL